MGGLATTDRDIAHVRQWVIERSDIESREVLQRELGRSKSWVQRHVASIRAELGLEPKVREQVQSKRFAMLSPAELQILRDWTERPQDFTGGQVARAIWAHHGTDAQRWARRLAEQEGRDISHWEAYIQQRRDKYRRDPAPPKVVREKVYVKDYERLKAWIADPSTSSVTALSVEMRCSPSSVLRRVYQLVDDERLDSRAVEDAIAKRATKGVDVLYVSDEVKLEQMRSLRLQGKSITMISDALRIGMSCVARSLRRMVEDGRLEDRAYYVPGSEGQRSGYVVQEGVQQTAIGDVLAAIRDSLDPHHIAQWRRAFESRWGWDRGRFTVNGVMLDRNKMKGPNQHGSR